MVVVVVVVVLKVKGFCFALPLSAAPPKRFAVFAFSLTVVFNPS
jgi:hypothetical protein